MYIHCLNRSGRYEVDGYVYNASEEPKILMTGKWNESMSYQQCDGEGEPLPGTELKEVRRQMSLCHWLNSLCQNLILIRHSNAVFCS